MGKLTTQNNTEPDTPSSGYTEVYVDSTSKRLSTKDDTGTVVEYGAAGGSVVLKADYNANTILAATTDDLPVAVTIAETEILGRQTGGNIGAIGQVSSGEITAGTATALRGYSPADIKSFVDTHGGSGDVTGPGSSTDNAIARFDGTGGKTLQDYTSNAPTISDSGVVSIPANELNFSTANTGIREESFLTRLYYNGTVFFDGNATKCYFRRNLESRIEGTVGSPSIIIDHTGGVDSGFFSESTGDHIGIVAGAAQVGRWTAEGIVGSWTTTAVPDAELFSDSWSLYQGGSGEAILKVNDGGVIKTLTLGTPA